GGARIRRRQGLLGGDQGGGKGRGSRRQDGGGTAAPRPRRHARWCRPWAAAAPESAEAPGEGIDRRLRLERPPGRARQAQGGNRRGRGGTRRRSGRKPARRRNR